MKTEGTQNNDELIAAGHELAKCLDSNTPLLDIAKMIVRLADKLDVTTAALREKAKQCEQLAAENTGIKALNDCLSEELREYESDGAFEGPKMHLLWWKTETPVTDAFLREVRAQGVEMLAELLSGMGISASETSVREFAAQLRNEVKG